MKSKVIKLNVDFIGGQSALTLQEEKALTEYFAKKRIATSKRRKAEATKRSKATKQPTKI